MTGLAFLAFGAGATLFGVDLGAVHCIGDSLTEGAGASAGTGGYRRPLDAELRRRGFRFHWVGTLETWPGGSWPEGRHDGHGGWATLDLITGRAGQGSIVDWLVQEQPDTIVLMIGRNDPWDWSYAVQRYRDLVTAIYQVCPQATLFWSNVFLPLDQGFWSRYQCDVLDSAIRQNVFEQRLLGRDVHYMDSYRSLQGRFDIFSDQVHLNDTGYGLLSQVFLRAIVKAHPVKNP